VKEEERGREREREREREGGGRDERRDEGNIIKREYLRPEGKVGKLA